MKEKGSVPYEARESIAGPHSTLENLGLQEKGSKKTGLTTATVATFTRTLDTGDKLYALAIDYAVAGLELERMLNRIAPQPDLLEIPRVATLDDWVMPDRAALGIAEDVRLHRAHQHIPGYRTFHADHRKQWLVALENMQSDRFYEEREATHFIDTTEFIISQSYKRESSAFGGSSPFGRRTELPPYGPAEEQLEYEFSSLYFGMRQRPLILLDPKTGFGLRQFDESSPVRIQQEPTGKKAKVSANDITAHIALGDVSQDGIYPEKSVTMSFPDTYKKDALLPLIAWKATPDGERMFLSNDEIHRFVPDSLTQGYDALLGRVVLPYLQPEVPSPFPQERGFADNKKGPQQLILPAQVPLLLYDQRLMANWLQTPVVQSLQESLAA